MGENIFDRQEVYFEKICKDIGDISDRLGDRISKEIYANKLMYSITNDVTYLRHIFDILDEEWDLLPDFNSHNNQPKVIFGCGRYGKFIKKCFPEVDWKCYVDNRALPDMVVEELPVISVEELRQMYPDAYIVVSPRYDYEAIEEQLKSNSFMEKDIYLYGEKQDFLESKAYFDLPYLEKCCNEVFVDAGVLDGESSLGFIRWSGGEYRHIHMFEPNVNLHVSIHSNMRATGNKYTLHSEGLWNCKDSMGFMVDEKHLPGAKVVDCSYKSDVHVNVIDLDTMLQGEEVTFIKMDIEGAEKQAIEGAKKTIQKYHPKLAISVYHKKSDLFIIPRTILSIDPEYKFYIRHYCLSAGDTVLYAI